MWCGDCCLRVYKCAACKFLNPNAAHAHVHSHPRAPAPAHPHTRTHAVEISIYKVAWLLRRDGVCGYVGPILGSGPGICTAKQHVCCVGTPGFDAAGTCGGGGGGGVVAVLGGVRCSGSSGGSGGSGGGGGGAVFFF